MLSIMLTPLALCSPFICCRQALQVAAVQLVLYCIHTHLACPAVAAADCASAMFCAAAIPVQAGIAAADAGAAALVLDTHAHGLSCC
jgi:hypothetical protein